MIAFNTFRLNVKTNGNRKKSSIFICVQRNEKCCGQFKPSSLRLEIPIWNGNDIEPPIYNCSIELSFPLINQYIG